MAHTYYHNAPEFRSGVKSADAILGRILLARLLESPMPLPAGFRATIRRSYHLLRLGSTEDLHGIAIDGPKGCGKTRNAEKLARFLGMSVVLDEPADIERYKRISIVPPGTLLLTNSGYVDGAFNFTLIAELMRDLGQPLDL